MKSFPSAPRGERVNGLFVLSLNENLIVFNVEVKCILSREEG